MFDTANIDKTSVARKSSNMAQVVDIIIILKTKQANDCCVKNKESLMN